MKHMLLNILLVNNHIPRPDKSGADLRLFQIIKALSALGHRITLVGMMPCPEMHAFEWINELGIHAYAGDADALRLHGYSLPAEWRFSEILKRERFDVALLSVWFWTFFSMPEQYMEQLWRTSPQTRIVALTDDRHGLRQLQIAELHNSLIEEELARDHAYREIEVYRKCDLVIAVAKPELEYIRACAPHTPAVMIPFTCLATASQATFHDREGICFLADFSNPAARDATEWLLKEIMPILIARSARLHLTIAGSYSQQFVQMSRDWLRVLGSIADLSAFFSQHRVFLSPLRFGTGVATKNVLAMAHSLPVVTTVYGAEALQTPGQGLLSVGTDAETLASHTLRLHEDPELWAEQASRCLSHLRSSLCVDLPLCLRDVLGMTMKIDDGLRAASPRWSSRLIHDQGYLDLRRSCWNRQALSKAYLRLGEALVAAGYFNQAANQFRHAMAVSMSTNIEEPLLAASARGLRSCYLMLGDIERCQRFDNLYSGLDTSRQLREAAFVRQPY